MEKSETKCPEPTLINLLGLKEERDYKDNRAKIERQRVDLAISLDICPVCGCTIIRRDIEYFNPPKSYFFNLFKIRQRRWDVRKVCSNDEKHYENKYDYDED